MREKKKETLKNCLIVIGFYISFIVFAIVSHKREAQEENQYHSRANFYLVGDIKKIKDREHMPVYEMKLDSVSFVENKHEKYYFWGICDTFARTVYFMMYEELKIEEQIIVDSKNRIIYDASTGDSIDKVYLIASPKREFLEEFENSNTIRF